MRSKLRDLGAVLAAAMAASDHADWAAALKAVRLVQGQAMITRGLLTCMLGQDAAADGPPLVRAVQAVGRLISYHEVDSLPPDELRARMRRVLQALDHELKALLSPSDEPPIA